MNPSCSGDAIEVAWKLRGFRYRNADGAVRALRRVHKGLTADQARHLIEMAEAVLQETIRIIKPKDNVALEEYRSRIPNGPSAEDTERFLQELKAKFPACTDEALRWALARAVFYHII